MFIEEYDAKQLLNKMAIPIPQGSVAHTPIEAEEVATSLGGPCVVKAQVPTGKRGKGGGIAIVDSAAEARTAAEKILGSMLNDFLVERVLVEERASIAQELYASVTIDPSRRCPLLIFSTEGGMDIEEVHEATPDKVLMVPIDIDKGLDQARALAILQQSSLGADHHAGVADMLVKLYAMYRQYDAQLVEINPLVLTTSGDVVALDCKLVIDDNSVYRQTELPEQRPIGTSLELEAAEQDFLFVELDGDVGVLANGAGLTMSTMDAVTVHGGSPANFLEVGGMAYKRATPALALVLKNPKVKSLLVNLCGAYARTDVIAEGIVEGWKALQPELPVSFCIHGTGEERARALIKEELGFDCYDKMDDAVKAAIQSAKK
ncbi:MAG: ADP-forming succinate--CoA ligase subunit beta [Chloroflexota bacterium]